ncbi:hypothetical protein N752_04015 [Desulforamulus aquiferis]|nr:hypothetical protein N752_04015 [Desulforamulus aquiferis]
MARGKASEVLNSHSQLENSSAQATSQMIRTGVGVQVNLMDLGRMLASRSNPVLPVIELTPSGTPQGPGLKENLPGIKPSEQKLPPAHGEITLTGSAVFNKNKQVGWLDMKETRGLLWIMNKVQKGVVTIPRQMNRGKIYQLD